MKTDAKIIDNKGAAEWHQHKSAGGQQCHRRKGQQISGFRHSMVQLQKWLPELPMLTNDVAKDCLQLDVIKRNDIFEQAFKEIRIMLYQNLWHKFRSQETENLAGSVGENIYSASDI